MRPLLTSHTGDLTESSRPITRVVPVRVTVIHDGQRIATDSQIREGVRRLNEHIGPHGFSFELDSIDEMQYASWASYDGPLYDSSLAAGLNSGDPGVLDVYVVSDMMGTLGDAVYPWMVVDGVDGVRVEDGTLPGGHLTPYNDGMQLVHQVGHWLGLYHPFQGGCAGGDHVADTPPQRAPIIGCPTTISQCIGSYPADNIMDMLDDACATELTDGQGKRMRQMWRDYRA